MVDDPFTGWGLRPVELADRAILDPYFASLSEPLSDYTFAQLFTWRNSLRILWKVIDGHLCVFANGSGDLTLLLPPIGDTRGDPALRTSIQMMDEYNFAHRVPDRTRVEYASEELLNRFDATKLQVQPMGADYIYGVDRMIDLAGGDLASKRQAKNRFLRLYEHRVEPYSPDRHRAACEALLEKWKLHQDTQHIEESSASSIKRAKESTATSLTLEYAQTLGLRGIVVYVKDGSHAEPDAGEDGFALRGFTFGEPLGTRQSSITIEKTDLAVKGLAQFIFSEFCRSEWAQRPLVNVGDDWGLQTLAWTKMSYRPVKMLKKFALRPAAVSAVVPAPTQLLSTRYNIEIPPPRDEQEAAATTIRAARRDDLDAASELEQANFTTHCLSKRQLKYLQQRETAIFLVGEQAGQIVGEGIALIRQHKNEPSGRIYSLVVRSEARGKKIGHKLLAAMVEALGGRGVRRVYLEVQADNAPAIKLYEQSGFRAIGTLPDYYGAGKAGLHMMHQIAAAQPLATASAPQDATIP